MELDEKSNSIVENVQKIGLEKKINWSEIEGTNKKREVVNTLIKDCSKTKIKL